MTISMSPTEAELSSLKGAYAAVLRRAESGKDYATIAGELGINIGTVKSRLNRARRALQRDREKQDLAAKAQETIAGLKDMVGGNG